MDPHQDVTQCYHPSSPPPMDPYLNLELGSLSPKPEDATDSECGPDLECAICFSQFNNVFRAPKILQCQHTFCLECLARMNVKSSQPDSIQCPLCRSLTHLPTLGLPRLANNRTVLSYLPDAMQRVYSVRFIRSKGRLQVKTASEHRPNLAPLGSISQTLDVGLPNEPNSVGAAREAEQRRRPLSRLCTRPTCRAFLLTSTLILIVLLIGLTIFFLTTKLP